MTSTPKKSTEAEDVLEFLNSIPENSKSGGGFKAKANKNVSGGGDNDILNFLDELEKTDKKVSLKDKKEISANETSKKEEKKDETITGEDTKSELEDVNIDETQNKEEEKQAEEEDFIDPIASISNWWSSSGSQKVNSFWNNAVTLTNKAGEEASKLAQIDELESKLKSLNLDNQARKLIDSSKHVVGKDSLKLLSENISNVLHSLNQKDEILTIYLIHDLINFSNLNDIVLDNFQKVLSQVQGSIGIEVIKQNTANSSKENFKKFNLFEGKLIDGEKLGFVNLESSIQSITKQHEESIQDENSSSTSTSNIFISILPIKQISKNTDKVSEIETIDQNSNDAFNFTIILKDITHDITIISRSQSFPDKWIKWLEGENDKKDKKDKKEDKNENSESESESESESDEGEVDPSEWVKEWIDDGLALTIGVLAQSYVVKRMGY